MRRCKIVNVGENRGDVLERSMTLALPEPHVKRKSGEENRRLH